MVLPARSIVSIGDVGAATAFLAHDAARLITGETLYIDGGYHLHRLSRRIPPAGVELPNAPTVP
jgi:enoyl-[acyl-carrier-protein] reductase (NADH)